MTARCIGFPSRIAPSSNVLTSWLIVSHTCFATSTNWALYGKISLDNLPLFGEKRM